MNTRMRLLALGIAAAGTALLFACGGGSSGGSASGSGTGTPTEASGVIDAFGSIFVNGLEYQTNSSTSFIDDDNNGAAANAAALQVGMTVDVSTDPTGHWADIVHFGSAVRGEVDSVNSTNNQLTVLGQTVRVSSGTSFAGSTTSGGVTTPVTQLSNISAGDYVVVYGYLQCTSGTSSACSATQVVATLIYVPATATVYRVEGYAENVSSSANTFTINGLTVAIATSGSGATVCTPSPCAITNGEFVVVRSTSAPTGSGSTLTLTAATVRQATQIPVYATGSTVSIAGPVSQLTSTSFVLRGLLIDGSNVASALTTLSDGEIVVVTGTVQSDGSILATTVNVVQHATFALMGSLTAQSGSADTITVLGQTFTLNSSTRFGDWAQGVRPFNLSNFSTVLSDGNQLIVSGYPTASGDIATRVERIPTPATPTAGAEGLVSSDSSSADTLVIGGVSIVLSSTTTLYYPGAGSSPSLSGFFGAITPGTSVAWVFGTPGTAAGTIDATVAAAMPLTCRWASPY